MDFPLKFKQLWSNWDIRVLILFSLSIQIILIFLGRLRKKCTWRWMRFAVWGSYLLANWVADFVLSQLNGSMGVSSSSNIIIAFWAPFFILHLGGPDTITAYSMEDNELWSRHLLGLNYELITASYVIFRALPDIRLLAPTLLIFLVAIIKYIERTYSFYNASAKGFRSSIIPSLERIDEFYTKAAVNHSKAGYVLRIFCSICILMAFSLFALVPKNDFIYIDVAVTYALLICAICLDVAATVMLVLSDWMVVALLNVQVLHNWHKSLAKCIVRIKNRCHKRRYWSIKSPQLNLFDNQLTMYAENEAPRESIMNWVAKKRVRKLHLTSLFSHERIYALRMTQPVQATQGVLETISSHLLLTWHNRRLDAPIFSAVHNVLNIPGFDVSKFVKIFEKFPLVMQVLVWHITTEICFQIFLECC